MNESIPLCPRSSPPRFLRRKSERGSARHSIHSNTHMRFLLVPNGRRETHPLLCYFRQPYPYNLQMFKGRKENTSQSTGQDKPQPLRRPRCYEDVVAGFGAGFVATAVGFPLDVLKTRLQTSKKAEQSVVETGKNIVKKEGVGGFYKGLASPLVTLSIQSSVSFSSYQVFRDLYKAQHGWHHGNFLAGMSCGPILGIISTVELHVRVSLELDLCFVVLSCSTSYANHFQSTSDSYAD